MVSGGYKYLDHTADIQVHSWGDGVEGAFVNAAYAMSNYMYDQSTVEENPACTRSFELAECRSLQQLLYGFLEEVLYLFVAEPYLAVNRIAVSGLVQNGPTFSLTATCFGEEYVRAKHGSRTEIKAVTRSNLQVERRADGSVETYVIFDI